MDHPRERAAVDDSSQQGCDSGSGAGRIQAVVPTAQEQADALVEAAYDAFFDHAHDCGGCRTTGEDCKAAAGLRVAIREAKAAAIREAAAE